MPRTSSGAGSPWRRRRYVRRRACGAWSSGNARARASLPAAPMARRRSRRRGGEARGRAHQGPADRPRCRGIGLRAAAAQNARSSAAKSASVTDHLIFWMVETKRPAEGAGREIRNDGFIAQFTRRVKQNVLTRDIVEQSRRDFDQEGRLEWRGRGSVVSDANLSSQLRLLARIAERIPDRARAIDFENTTSVDVTVNPQRDAYHRQDC